MDQNNTPTSQPTETEKQETSTPVDSAQETKSPSLLDGDQPETSWTDTLPEDLKGNKQLANFKDQNEVFRSYLNQQKLVGKKGLVIPSENATQEEIEEYCATRRGNIKAIQDYTCKPENSDFISKETFDKVAQLAFNNGLSDREFAKTLEAIYTYQQDEIKQIEAEEKENFLHAKLELQDTYGNKLGEKLKAVNALMNKFPQVRDTLIENGLDNNAAIFKMLASFAEDTAEGGNAFTEPTKVLDAKLLEKEREAIENNPLFYKRGSPAQAELRQRYNAINSELAQRKI